MKERTGNGNGMGTPLSIAVQLLPTPTTQDGANTAGPSQFHRNTPPLNVVATLLPTPRASDGEKGGPNQRGSSGDLMLPSAVVQLLPTPRSVDHKASMTATAARQHVMDGNGSLAEVLGVEMSPGGRMSPPSDAGSTSPDDPPQHQQSQGATDLDSHLF
ncbi:hypothetical protein [Williamsia serinedens]|uniref:hypothetical protein n=1 Tax=Williamsia serinedens TaxID=391736 RepID=UPI0031DC7330